MTGDLEEIRVLRNSVGHMFGREGDFARIRDLPLQPASARISEPRLQKVLGIAMEAAIEIDNHLGQKHIGQYEALLFYHNWRRPHFQDTAHEALMLSKETSVFEVSTTGGLTGKNFCRGLIEYYKSV